MKRSRYLILIISVIFILCCYTFFNSFFSPNIPPISSPPLIEPKIINPKIDNFLKCIKDAAKIHYSETDKFFGKFSVCLKTHIPIDDTQLDFFNNRVNDENKVFLPMSDEFRQNKVCKWLTAGIGGSSRAEELVKTKYPNCEIYGIDPTNIGNFSKIGKVLPFGVGIDDSKIMLSVDMKEKGYIKKPDTVMSLPRVLDEFVHSRLVHYLSIDIEGLEMLILAELIGYGKLANENINFCQIDVELHDPKQDSINPLASDINRVQWMLDFLAEASPYLPIYTTPYLPAYKVTFVNTENPECEEAFKINTLIS